MSARVGRSKFVPQNVTGGVPQQVPGWWWGGIESVPLGSAGNLSDDTSTTTGLALREIWDYWDMQGLSVVSRSTEGLPTTPWGGDRVLKWFKPYGATYVYQKVNRTFFASNFPSGLPSRLSSRPAASPADASGRYIVYMYIPSALWHLDTSHAWYVLTEFKENYDSAGFHQDALAGVTGNNFSGTPQFSFSPHNSPSWPLTDITNRWFKIEERVYQDVRTEFYLDDVLMDTIPDSTIGAGSGQFSVLSSTDGFIWIAGQYTSNQTTNSVPDTNGIEVTTYIGLSCLLPLP